MKKSLNNLLVKFFKKNEKRTLLVDVSKPIDYEYLYSIRKDWNIIINPRCEIPHTFDVEGFYNIVNNSSDVVFLDEFHTPGILIKELDHAIKVSRNRKPIKDSIKVGEYIEDAKHGLPSEYLNKK